MNTRRKVEEKSSADLKLDTMQGNKRKESIPEEGKVLLHEGLRELAEDGSSEGIRLSCKEWQF